jgi:hypothetical protein
MSSKQFISISFKSSCVQKSPPAGWRGPAGIVRIRIFQFLRYKILRDRGIGDASVCSSWSTQLPWAGILEPGWHEDLDGVLVREDQHLLIEVMERTHWKKELGELRFPLVYAA